MSLTNDLTSFAATAVRLGRGVYPRVTAGRRADPPLLLELYDFEGCPFCRKVREVLCELDLDYLGHPVARGSPRRAELVKRGGKMQAPYLVDPNTRTELYESDDIIAYLNAIYGAGARAGWRLPVPRVLDDANSMLASAVRLGRGARCRTTRERGIRPLVLYNMEGSPYCRKVREALSELDLEHIVRNVPKGSPKRAALVERGGKMQVPYLIDPNTERALYESDDIVAYLEGEYA
ncbi:MAG TPA: glutathione S-transferase N-terminal domain-containing protein [Candidatus Limnocylindria bacterium]|nr:glutathione S-transferase N-terminal domain-containing protein [Candidatus Limnocylindria bacterium]